MCLSTLIISTNGSNKYFELFLDVMKNLLYDKPGKAR